MSSIDQDIQEPAAATRIQMQDMQDSTDRSARVYEKSYRLGEPGSCGRDGRLQGTPSNQHKC